MSEVNVQTKESVKHSRINVTISKDSMTASVIVKKPQSDEPPVKVDEILQALNNEGVVFGINNQMIADIIENKTFNTPVKVADGQRPKRGANSEFKYHFDTAQEHKPQVDPDGRIDYKNINFIQNIEKDGILVTRIPAKPGEPGTNVLGRSIKGPDGSNLPFKYGANTVVSEDGNSLIATCSGAIVFLYNKVSVNDVTLIKGDVDFSVGNLDCRGSVRVTGSVKAGFAIKTDGDLEVNGTVEDANLDVKGNIMIKGGFFGKGSGVMKAGGDVFVKFVEGQKIFALGDVIVGGEVVNCHIESNGNVYVKGAKGKIVGGHTKARKEIKASFLGSEAGTVTELSVAYDPQLMKKYHECQKEMIRLNDDSERIKKVLVELYRLQMDNKLSPEQEGALKKLEDFQNSLPSNLEALETQKRDIEAEMKKLEGAEIVAEKKIYPGVKGHFGLIYREIMEETTRCVLRLDKDNNKIFISEYHKED